MNNPGPDQAVTAHSGASPASVWSYIRQITITLVRSAALRPPGILARAALLQLALDMGLFLALLALGADLVTAHLISFAAAASATYILSVRRSFPPGAPRRRLDADYTLGALLVLFLRGGFLAAFTQKTPLPLWAAAAATVLATALASSGQHLLLYGVWSRDDGRSRRRGRAVLGGLILYLLALRIVHIIVPGLISEEAYYWNYSQHLDWGYLDHPPMAAWLIRMGTLPFGQTEFGVRIGAVASWLIAAGFASAMARDLIGRVAGARTLLLASALPFFFGIGCLLTPDPPLTACWAGALFFLVRALLRNQTGAWFGAGICIGLGMLSKYTIALLAPATGLFLLADSGSRRWLRRPQPYLAALAAVALFSPVICWNATHNWASFLFQTSRRLTASPQFSLHVLFGEVLLLLTPTALAGVFAILIVRKQVLWDRLPTQVPAARVRLFVLIFTLTPVAVVTVFSLTHEPKLNWTGPSWLAILPILAWTLYSSESGHASALLRFARRAWRPTLVVVTVVYGVFLHYLALGFPGVPYPPHTSDIAGWKQLAGQVSEVRETVARQTGAAPLIAGMDRYNISSELAFYLWPEGPRQTAGRHLFGESALMYAYWFPDSLQTGKTVIIVARERGDAEKDGVVSRFDSLSAIGMMPVSLNQEAIGQYYYRVGYGYRGAHRR